MLQREYVRKYEQRFGKLNYRARIGDFEWVFLAACLATGGPTSEPRLHDATMQFLDELAATRRGALPRVLVSHIPLFRSV